jgi:hypothetical protein
MNLQINSADAGDAGLVLPHWSGDTGIGKETLRVWERRYGFPQPLRDAFGERVYPADQVARLRLIKRLMDKGGRPGNSADASRWRTSTGNWRKSRWPAPIRLPTG